jgi:hypothetical protein
MSTSRSPSAEAATRARLLVALALGLSGSGAVGCKGMSRDLAEAGTAFDAGPAEGPMAPSSYASPGRAPRPPCRAMAATGAVNAAGSARGDASDRAPLAVGSTVTDALWITLDRDASLTIEDGRSGRDILLAGPAEARACVGDDEETWLASGAFESSPGSGEVPGAEEWVVTPFAVVRYSGAKLAIHVEGTKANVQVKSGTAHAYLTHPRTSIRAVNELPVIDNWTRIEAGRSMDLGTGDLGQWRARDDASRCAALADTARELAGRVRAATDPALVADLGPKHVAARLSARAACAVAALRVDRLPDDADRGAAKAKGELTSVVRVAEGSWRGAP